MTIAEHTELDRKLTAAEARAGSDTMRANRPPVDFTLREMQFIRDAVEIAWRMARIARTANE